MKRKNVGQSKGRFARTRNRFGEKPEENAWDDSGCENRFRREQQAKKKSKFAEMQNFFFLRDLRIGEKISGRRKSFGFEFSNSNPGENRKWNVVGNSREFSVQAFIEIAREIFLGFYVSRRQRTPGPGRRLSSSAGSVRCPCETTGGIARISLTIFRVVKSRGIYRENLEVRSGKIT